MFFSHVNWKSYFFYFVLLLPASLFACSSFGIYKDSQITVGKNLDWVCSDAWLVVNKRHVTKKAFQLLPRKSKLSWTSKYGSVTFVANSVGISAGGMNEAGLVIEESWLMDTQYPEPDHRPAINEIQWIQYQLDNCSTVEEVINTDDKLRIKSYAGPSHYFVYDSRGKAAAIEFTNGKMTAHVLDSNDVQVLTNDTYSSSKKYLENHNGFGGDQSIADCATGSLERFACAAKKIKDYSHNDSNDIVSYSFDILKSISQEFTAWSVVYDIPNRAIHYKTAENTNIRSVYLRKFDFSCQTPVMVIDVHTKKTGDISTYFELYTRDKHEKLVNKVIQNWRAINFAMHITDADVVRMIDYPETMLCAE